MTRQEIYQHIKTNHLEDDIKSNFKGRNYTNISTPDLEEFLIKRIRKAERRLSGMTESQSNTQCNAKIINIIRNFVSNNPTLRFGEIIYNLDLNSVMKSDTSQEVLQRINASINRDKRH